jgi:hypothetical protein
MAGGAETPNIAALPAIARLGTYESAPGPDADWHAKLLSQFAVEGSLWGAYSYHDVIWATRSELFGSRVVFLLQLVLLDYLRFWRSLTVPSAVKSKQHEAEMETRRT